MKIIKTFPFKIILSSLAVLFLLSGCSDDDVIKDTYCGVHINYQYCKCAFHNEYCDSIGMKKGEAKDYVYDKYDEWLVGESGDEIKEVTEEVEESDDENTKDSEGECKYNSDCDPICEGDVAWKMGCNAYTNTCEKTFDNDCSSDVEIFGSLDFQKICEEGVCMSDTKTIELAKANLLAEKKVWSDTVKEINAVRLELNQAMLDANKNCLNGIADMTNLAIVEFSTRIASVLAGGIPDVAAMTASAASKASGLVSEHVKNLASAAVDYAGFSLEKLKAYQQGIPTEESKQLKPHEYIKLNCDLYQYFKEVQAESDVDLQTALDNAAEADRLYKELP